MRERGTRPQVVTVTPSSRTVVNTLDYQRHMEAPGSGTLPTATAKISMVDTAFLKAAFVGASAENISFTSAIRS